MVIYCFQVFRSIDSGSVKGFPKGVKEAEAQVKTRLVLVIFSLICEVLHDKYAEGKLA